MSLIHLFLTFQRNISKSNNHILPSLLPVIGRLTQDDVIRHTLAHDAECWKAFLAAIVSKIRDSNQKHADHLLFGLVTGGQGLHLQNISNVTSQ